MMVYAVALALDSEEAERAFVEAGLPCSRILSHMEMLDNPHYLARESLTKWPRVDGGELTGQNVTPKLAKNPGRIWRGCPLPGMDNEDILGELGYTSEEIAEMYADGVIKNGQ